MINKCKYCDNTGIMQAVNITTSNTFIFKCKCINGNKRKDLFLPIWNDRLKDHYLPLIDSILNYKNMNKHIN